MKKSHQITLICFIILFSSLGYRYIVSEKQRHQIESSSREIKEIQTEMMEQDLKKIRDIRTDREDSENQQKPITENE